jgi:hypothetical protein
MKKQSCYHSCGQIFDLVVIKLGQNACLGMKNYVTGAKNRIFLLKL